MEELRLEKVELENISSNYVVGIINKDKFGEIQREVNNTSNTITYRDCPFSLIQEIIN